MSAASVKMLCASFVFAVPERGEACIGYRAFDFADVLEADLVVEGRFVEVESRPGRPNLYTFDGISVIHGDLDPVAGDSLREGYRICWDDTDCTDGPILSTSDEMRFAWSGWRLPASIDEFGQDARSGLPARYIAALRHPSAEHFYRVLDGERVFLGPSRERYSVLHEPCSDPHVFLASSPYGAAVKMIFEQPNNRLEMLVQLEQFIRRSSYYCESGRWPNHTGCE